MHQNLAITVLLQYQFYSIAPRSHFHVVTFTARLWTDTIAYCLPNWLATKLELYSMAISRSPLPKQYCGKMRNTSFRMEPISLSSSSSKFSRTKTTMVVMIPMKRLRQAFGERTNWVRTIFFISELIVRRHQSFRGQRRRWSWLSWWRG